MMLVDDEHSLLVSRGQTNKIRKSFFIYIDDDLLI